MATTLELSILGKLKGALPVQWFGDSSPNSDAALAGASTAAADVYTLVQEITPQMRIRTSTDGFLDMASGDFFGNNLTRRPAEPDSSYLVRILASLFREQGTKKAMSDALGGYTGIYPLILEYGQSVDTTGFVITKGTDTVSGYGTTVKPHHAFITVYTISPLDFESIPGYGSNPSGYGLTGAYVPQILQNYTYLFQLINAIKPIGTKIWVRVITADIGTLISTYGVTQVDPTLMDSFGGILTDNTSNILTDNTNP